MEDPDITPNFLWCVHLVDRVLDLTECVIFVIGNNIITIINTERKEVTPT